MQAEAVAKFAEFGFEGHRLLWRFHPLRLAGGHRPAVLQQPAHRGAADAAQGAGDDGDSAGGMGHGAGLLWRSDKWLGGFFLAIISVVLS